MYNKWGGEVVQVDGSVSDDDRSRASNIDMDRASVRSLEETQASWLLGAGEPKKKRGIDLGCMVISRRMCCILLSLFLFCVVIVGLTVLIIETLPRHHKPEPVADNYTQALHKALLFFDAQKSGKLPTGGFRVPWRGDSGLRDGLDNPGGIKQDLVGGFYDAGDNIKFTFPGAYALTMLSWSVVEYKAKYVAAKEYDHVRDLIKWGTDYMLKTFNYTNANKTTISYIFAQVGSGSQPTASQNDHYCWESPESIDYSRYAYSVTAGSDLAGEMAAAMAAASIVFKDQTSYSNKLLAAAKALLFFAEDHGKRTRYTAQVSDPDSLRFYNSSGYWDEYLWANAWLYFASGNVSYLARATTPGLARNANAGALGTRFYGILSWDNKLLGAQVLLTRLRIMESPPYPYEDQLTQFNNQTSRIMCSYLPMYKEWNQTKGGLTLFNYGQPSPLQYTAASAFMASLFADYLITADIPVWQCGQEFFLAEKLKDFARSQIDYLLWNNPLKMSYVVGFGKKYPQQVHHRGASIPDDKNKYGCTGGFRFRDANAPNSHVINGAMVGGPDKFDRFLDRRNNYTYTEPTVAGNAGLVGALISLSEVAPGGVDRNTIFADLPSMYISPPPPPSPWKPFSP
ncbi:unnamed protein product [Calypogeia fissa]